MDRLSYTVQLPHSFSPNWNVQYCRPQDAGVKYKAYPLSRLEGARLNYQLIVF